MAEGDKWEPPLGLVLVIELGDFLLIKGVAFSLSFIQSENEYP